MYQIELIHLIYPAHVPQITNTVTELWPHPLFMTLLVIC